MARSYGSSTIGPDRLETKAGGGCLALFGLPFLIAGLGVMSVPFWSADNEAPVFVLIPFGLVFATIGSAFVFGRSGFTADKQTKEVTKWWGLLVPFQKTVIPFNDIRTITISREVRRSKNSTYTVYPVRLAGSGEAFNIEEPRDFHAARRKAEEFAKFLDLGVEDSSSGKKVVREAGTLDESLRDRYRREGRPTEQPVEPSGCRVVTSASGSEAVFDIPPRGIGIGEYIAFAFLGIFLLISLSIGGGIAGTALSEADDLPLPLLIFMVIFGLVWVSVPLGIIAKLVSSARARDKVVVSPKELRLERKGLVGVKTTVIPTDELEELEIGGDSDRRTPFRRETIVARSDESAVQFGAGLNADELKWLHDVVKFIVTA